MQGKCQKVYEFKKNCKISTLFSSKSTILLSFSTITSHKAKKHFAKRPNKLKYDNNIWLHAERPVLLTFSCLMIRCNMLN
jgi:hypothetical protein